MPLVTKLLLFCSVPALLLGLLAIPSMRSKRPRGAQPGEAWASLEAAGVSYSLPAGWRVDDPLHTGTRGLETRWSMAWPPKSVHAAAFFPPVQAGQGAAQLTVFAGARAELEKIALDASAYYRGNRLIERSASTTWKSADGLELAVEQAHTRPGSLGGGNTHFFLAFGARGERCVLVNAGGTSAALTAETVQRFLAGLSIAPTAN